MEVSGQLYGPAALPSRKNDTEQAKGLDEPQSRSGRKRIQLLQNVSHPACTFIRISDMKNIRQTLQNNLVT
jgi:hypothetical protein